MEFSDGVKFDTSGEYRVERRKDGYYVVGGGSLIPVDSRDDGEEMIKDLKGDSDVQVIVDEILDDAVFGTDFTQLMDQSSWELAESLLDYNEKLKSFSSEEVEEAAKVYLEWWNTTGRHQYEQLVDGR